MDEVGIRAAEQRVWATIKDAAPRCDMVEICDPWRKGAPLPFQVVVGEEGQGLLDWLSTTRRKAVRSIASGPVRGDWIQFILIQTATNSIPVNVRLLARSSWSRAGVPLTEALTYPEGIILGKSEAPGALSREADYRCLWFTRKTKPSWLYAFSAEVYSEWDVLDLASRLSRKEFQEGYFTLGGLGLKGKYPRHTRKYRINAPPSSRFLLIRRQHDPLLAMARTHTRLFQEHRVFEILSLLDPIPELIEVANE